jgi:hypothetical protein
MILTKLWNCSDEILEWLWKIAFECKESTEKAHVGHILSNKNVNCRIDSKRNGWIVQTCHREIRVSKIGFENWEGAMKRGRVSHSKPLLASKRIIIPVETLPFLPLRI